MNLIQSSGNIKNDSDAFSLKAHEYMFAYIEMSKQVHFLQQLSCFQADKTKFRHM